MNHNPLGVCDTATDIPLEYYKQAMLQPTIDPESDDSSNGHSKIP